MMRRDDSKQFKNMKPNMKGYGTGALLGVMFTFPFLLGDQLFAQEQNSQEQLIYSSSLEEVVVTARRRDEDIFDVPVAVSVLTADDLDRYASKSIEKMADLTPNINFGYTAGGHGAAVSIRGIGTDGSNSGVEQSVLIDIDGVSTSRGRALWLSYFDLEKVEILKGPQSLFFGKNSPAGVIALTSKSSTEKFEAYFKAGYEFKANEVIGEGAISGPISGGFGARLAVRARDMEGFMRNNAKPIENPSPTQPPLLPGAVNQRPGEREVAARLTLDYDQGGPFNATLKVLVGEYEDDGPMSRIELVHCSSGSAVVRSILRRILPDPIADCRADWVKTATDISPEVASKLLNGRDGIQYTDQSSNVSSLELNYDFGNMALTGVTGYHYSNAKYLMNNDWSSFATIAATEQEKYDAFSQELRLLSDFEGSFNFMFGGYYQKTDLNFTRSLKLDDLPPDPVTGKYQWADLDTGTDGETLSLFAQLIWDVNDQLELAGGARWSHEEKDSFTGVTHSNPLVAAAFPVRTIVTDFDDNDVSPEATITWHASDDIMLYGAYKRGYKSGGAGIGAIPNAALTKDQLDFKPEKARGFEVGTRMRLADSHFIVSATAYRYTYSDLQLNAFDTATTSFFTRNAAKARMEGVESEFSWLATDELALRGALAYNRSRYRSFPNAQCYSGQTVEQGCVFGGQDLSGRPTALAPEWSGSLGVTYTKPVFNDYILQFSADGVYSDDYVASNTQAPFHVQGSYEKYNAGILLFPSDEKWSVALIGRNLSNEKVLLTMQDRPGGIGDARGTLNRPREVLIEVTTRF